MPASNPVVDRINDYHIHVYYDAGTKQQAEALRAKLEAAFPSANYGRWHDNPVGPHPEGSYQVHFSVELFAEIVPYTALQRGDLTVLVHPNTGEDLEDHSDYAMWMGSMPDLKLGIFDKSQKGSPEANPWS
ncbi:MAG: DOPA 4,5-dioxygenase family protein [Alphaproteobacteria bacterium]|jgi:aromatic ring-cleaving dioxygenase